MDSIIKPKILVDAVITWVDGSDKDLLKKKSEYLSSEKESKIQNLKNQVQPSRRDRIRNKVHNQICSIY